MLVQEVSNRRVSVGDLVEKQFGHIVSVAMAEKIALGLLNLGALQVFNETSRDPIGPEGLSLTRAFTSTRKEAVCF